MDARLVCRATVVPEDATAVILALVSVDAVILLALASADAVVHIVSPNIPKFEGARRHESSGCG
jgi:hypothetical protein